MKNQAKKYIATILLLTTICTLIEPRWNVQEILYNLGLYKPNRCGIDAGIMSDAIDQLEYMQAHRPIRPIESLKDCIRKIFSHIPFLGIKPHHRNTCRLSPGVFAKKLKTIETKTQSRDKSIQNHWIHNYWTKSEEEVYNRRRDEYNALLHQIKHPKSLRDNQIYRAVCDKKPPFNKYNW